MQSVHLLNSAVMPQPGIYHAKKITWRNFCEILEAAYQLDRLKSYIGYQQNIDLIKEWTKITVDFSREQVRLEDGDLMLVMKLKYRVKDPRTKGEPVSADSFEYYLIAYQEEER